MYQILVNFTLYFRIEIVYNISINMLPVLGTKI